MSISLDNHWKKWEKILHQLIPIDKTQIEKHIKTLLGNNVRITFNGFACPKHYNNYKIIKRKISVPVPKIKFLKNLKNYRENYYFCYDKIDPNLAIALDHLPKITRREKAYVELAKYNAFFNICKLKAKTNEFNVQITQPRITKIEEIKPDYYRLKTQDSRKYSTGYHYYIKEIKVPKYIFDAKEFNLRMLNHRNAEIRSLVIRIFGLETILNSVNHEEIETITGYDLYNQSLIGDYAQQGDVLLKPRFIRSVSFKDLDEQVIERLKKIQYKLFSMKIASKQREKMKVLLMDNPSIDHKHIERVGNNCSSVFDALCWRNKSTSLPYLIS